MAFSIVLRAYTTIVPFAIRTVFIYSLGVDYLGLNGLFTSLLGVLNLAELGVGTALVYSMYRPLAEGDDDTVCALMTFYRKSYRVIGCVILVVGLVLMPFLPALIKADLPPDINLNALYLLNLAGTLSTYFLFAYRGSIFTADQRGDVLSKVQIAVSTVQYVLQALALMPLKNYYLYVAAVPLCSALGNVSVAILSRRRYPGFGCRGTLGRKQLMKLAGKIGSLFVVKIGSVVLGSVDSIVISTFLGLEILGVYSNYYLVITSLVSMVGLLTSSIISSLGNSLATENEEKNYNDFRMLSFWNFWLVGWCSICFVCLSQSFMRVWVGEGNLLPFGIVLLLAAYFYVLQSNQVAGAYKDAAGIWESDRWRPLVTAATNLAINLALVNVAGLYGVILSTVLSLLLVNTPWLVKNVHLLVFKRGAREYVLRWVANTAITLFSGIITYAICSAISNEGLIWLLVKFAICLIVPNIIIYLAYLHTAVFQDNKDVPRRVIINLMGNAE